MLLGGIVDISTKDIPGRVAMVLFTSGCNFNCNFCHNKYLLKSNRAKHYKVDEILSIIKNNPLINSVSITGGEPTLQEDLIDLCREIKNKVNKNISIDTNGSNPDIIKNLIPYINRIALDVKSPLTEERLKKIIQVNIDPNKIIETFNLINQENEIEFEIRTTYVKNLLTLEDIDEIINYLIRNNFRGSYVLQQYQYSEGVGKEFKNTFYKPSHRSLLNILESYKDRNLPFEIYLRDDIIGYCNLREICRQSE